MPGDQLEALLDNPAMRDAIAVVFERSNGGNEDVQWTEVRDALSSEQWGRLIRQEVLVEAGGGFALTNPDRVEQYLKRQKEPSDVAEDTDDVENDSWAWYDKVAGLTTLVLFAGYWSAGIRNIIASLDNVILAPATDLLPFYAVVLVLATVTGFYSTVLQARLMDTEKMQAYQEQLTELRERKEAAKDRGDEDALERIREEEMEAFGDQVGMFKLQFRPMVWIMLLTIPVFLWLRWKVRGGHLGSDEIGLVVPIAGAVTWQESLFGPMPTWIVWYFVCSIAVRQLIQKTFGVQPPPMS